MSLPEGICERVVIGSQARLRIWCLRAYGFESLRSHVILEIEECSPVSFFYAREQSSDKRSGPRGFIPLCHCVTSPWGNGNVCRRFGRSHVIKRSRSVPRSLFLRLREAFWKTLRASRFRTPLSLRDISRGRMETSVAVSVARTFFRDRGVCPGLFFLRLRELFGETLRASRPRTPLSLRDISRGRTETSVAGT